MKNILILTDYKGEFQCSIKNMHDYTSMDIDLIVSNFVEYGYECEVKMFTEIDFAEDYNNYIVIYHSSEDNGLFYKSYIEDVVSLLNLTDAIIIPSLTYLRAHHNKSFMEMLRYRLKDNRLKSISSFIYGTRKDCLKKDYDFPLVLKVSEGSGSNGVKLIRSKDELVKQTRILSRIIYGNSISLLLKRGINSLLKSNTRSYTEYRNKFIIQNFISNLSGDYKVLYFAGKYYILGRSNRKNDFRASGSGILWEVPDKDVIGILNFAKLLIDELQEPILGIDIAFDGKNYHLIEFQAGIFIGPYTLQASSFWFENTNNSWKKINGKSILEKEYCRSIHEKIKQI